MSGRGWYYKNKYGGGGRGRGKRPFEDGYGGQQGGYGGGRGRGGGPGGGGWHQQQDEPMVDSYSSREGTGSQLADELRRLDGRPYPAYKDLIGSWNMGDFTLLLDKAQSDPYAPPSHFRVRVPQSVAKFPAAAYNSKIRNVALCDYLTRQLCQAVSAGGLDNAAENRGWHGSKGGDVRVETPGQHVIQRSAVVVNDQFVEARCTIALPAQGRSIEGHKAAQTLTQYLPHVVAKSLLYAALNASHLHAFLDSIEDQEHLRQSLADHDLVAFVADGSVLPRRSGADDQPMKPSEENHLQVFQSPPSMQLTMHVPHRGAIRGMGIRKGITLICGGGFHGKSTLLEALQVGIYNHIPGDGREFVAVDPNAVKIRAEDGRSVHLVDISPFINNLPFEKDTTRFNSEDASGSTSQAANIMEALEIGATTLLVDEDTCATNFMIRDRRMQQLVGKSREPITAFIYKVKPLLTQHNVSTIMVVGGSGDFFEVADTVILMDKYRPYDVTQEAKQITVDIPVPYQSDEVQTATATQHHAFGSIGHRIIDSNNFQTSGKVSARSLRVIGYGDTDIELNGVEQLVETGQARAIADAMRRMAEGRGPLGAILDGQRNVREVLELIDQVCSGDNGLDHLSQFGHPIGEFVLPRRFEVGAAINRLRTLRIRGVRWKLQPGMK